jgi:RNA polymerase sigma factor (TIGR02999 family)
MNGSDEKDISNLLRDLCTNKSEAESKLIAAVYPELRRMAAGYLGGERPSHTLQPSAVVNEAFIHLRPQLGKQWQNRSHFFAVAALVMRRVLVDYARHRNSRKGVGGHRRVEFSETLVTSEERLDEILAIDQALERLSEWDPRQCRVVELRFFGGLTEDEVADVLGISPRTVKREWSLAKAWLYGELNRHPPAKESISLE